MLLVFGSLNVDYVTFVPRAPRPGETVPGTRFAMHPGGKGANQAYAAARLGADVRLIGRVGRDPQGEWLLSHLQGGGVDVSAIARIDTAGTGVALIVVDGRGQNSIVVVAGANGTWSARDVDQVSGRMQGARVVLVQLETPIDAVEAAIRAARRAGATVLLDPAPARPLPDGLLHGVDVLTPNETELAALCGEDPGELQDDEAVALAGRIRRRGVARVIAKLGGRGALLVGPDGERHRWPAFDVPVVDTTAAGDAFNAALAVSLAEGAPLEAAGRFACAAAARSVTREGAQTGMPTRDEVEALLNSQA